MRRKRPLVAELLEARTLLSSLSYSLTTNQSVYQVGQAIQITFTETNTSNQPVTVEVSPTDFEVSQNGSAVWQSDPGNASRSPTAETLEPGKSVQQTATWDGTTSYSLGRPAGSASWQLNNFGTFSVSNPNGPQGLSATFQITNPITENLTTDKPVYQLGEPVHVTFTEVNTATVPVTFFPASPTAEEADIFHDGTALWLLAYPQVIDLDPSMLAAGQTRTAAYTFNIIPESGPYTLNKLTGTFVAGYGPENDPTLYTASFQVDAPSPDDLVTSVTTDQATYALGQPVNMNFTETNDGDQPSVVLTGPTSFQISENGTPIWHSAPQTGLVAAQPSWTTLQPGQSYSQTASWNGLPNLGSLSSLSGVFSVANELDPQSDSASFQFAPPSSSQLSTSVTTDKPVYQLGQPIQLSFTETNVGTTPIQVLIGPTSFNVMQTGAEIWSSIAPGGIPGDNWETLSPGQSMTQTATWNGVPNNVPAAFSNGTFTVSNALDPRAESATFQIVAPPAADLSTTVTTDRSVYDYGEPIQLTLTETNVGSQPIVVLTGPTAFEITHDGAIVWDTTFPKDLPANTSWVTLQPRQSYTQTSSWDGTTEYTVTSPQATGTFSVSNLLDPNGAAASFQIVASGFVSPPVVAPTPPSNTWPVTAKLVTNESAYKQGQSVHLSMKLENLSAAKVRVAPDAGPDAITVMDGSTVVFRSSRIGSALAVRSIKPHRSIKLALAWSGRPNQSGIRKLAPGTYTVDVVEGGYSGSTTIRIVR